MDSNDIVPRTKPTTFQELRDQLNEKFGPSPQIPPRRPMSDAEWEWRTDPDGYWERRKVRALEAIVELLTQRQEDQPGPVSRPETAPASHRRPNQGTNL